MEIKNVKIKELKLSEYNPRKMDDDELEKLKKSVEEFGVVEPIVVNKDLSVIGGHQRIKVLELLSRDEAPCVVVDLDKKKEKLLNLALNRIVGEWDEKKLATLVKDISEYPDAKLSGLDEEEMEMLNVQYDLSFGNDNDVNINPENEEELKRLFDRKEKVEVPVEKPNVAVRKNRIAFYVRNIDEFKAIKNYFKTNRKEELDIDKLIGLISDGKSTN